ncbi:hypothetical protein [Planotetraspora mira]|jgi:hypothetical protein|uniref:Uncharacterized protein n=1 Tax=Planotetraspora mira TaxID=58121 RepID=A0A8J3XAF5_9ACTN|nr:hypothetical protein [Planotetraspora mira]GII33426.1 hypothetical protein Pmi06nite_68680 [Planotetraspora mira]
MTINLGVEAATREENNAALTAALDQTGAHRLRARPDVAVRRSDVARVVQRVRDGRLRTNIGTVAALDDAVVAVNPTEPVWGKGIIGVRR